MNTNIVLSCVCVAMFVLLLFNSNVSVIQDTRQMRNIWGSSGDLELCKVEVERLKLDRGLLETTSTPSPIVKDCGPELSQCQAQVEELKLSKSADCPPAISGTVSGYSHDGVNKKPLESMSVEELRQQVLDMRELNERHMSEIYKLQKAAASGSGANIVSQEALDAAKKLVADCGSASSSNAITTVANVGDVWKGYACKATDEELKRYLDYTPRDYCPNDWYFVQMLIFKKDCFSLPRRRCLSLTPQNPTEPTPFPQSLFSQDALKDSNIRWDLHQCKSFECLTTRAVGDCRNCFNLHLESNRWRNRFHGSPTMKEVLAMKPGGLRIGLDAGGGTGSFAAHMALHNVTILTTAMNIETVPGRRAGLPYMETIAARGVMPLHVPHGARLPFFDGTLDIVHSMNTIKYFPPMAFEELLFEWDRVLRTGGIMWFETFYAPVGEMPVYLQIIELLGYNKLYWNFTPKVDVGEKEGEHVYLNAVIEKPVRTGGAKVDGPPKEDTMIMDAMADGSTIRGN